MQFRRSTLSALLGAAALTGNLQGASALVLSASAAAESGAVAWLRARKGAPQPDELAELRAVNPEAYGLVKALLTKRSLGLLDPRHPTASFAVSSAPAAEVPSGPGAFDKFAGDAAKPKVAALYPEVADAAAAPHNWLNWKPQQSAVDDESTVQQVLGVVDNTKAMSQATDAAQNDAPVSVSAPVEQVAAAPAEEAPTPSVSTKPIASMSQENSYLKGFDFGSGALPSLPKKNDRENSYLKEFDLGVEPAVAPRPIVGLSSVSTASSSRNYLTSFSWDDATPAPRVQVQAARPSVTAGGAQKVATSNKKKDALLAWLNPAAAKRVAVTTQAPSQDNTYLKDLNLN